MNKERLSEFDSLVFIKDESGIILYFTELGALFLILAGIGMAQEIFMSLLRLLKRR